MAKSSPIPDTLGFRAILGAIVPSTNTVVQPEYEGMRVPGVTNHTMRMELPTRPYDDMKKYREALDTEEGNLAEAVRLLVNCEPDVIAHGHSIHSFRGNIDRAQADQDKLAALAGVPFMTPSVSVVRGLEAMGLKRIAVLTPYWPPADELIRSFFVDSGFDVVSQVGMKCQGPTNVARTSLDAIRAAFLELDHPDAEAFVHVGTNLPVSAITEDIEKASGKPLIGVNVATYWNALRSIGIQDRKEGYGRLFAEF